MKFLFFGEEFQEYQEHNDLKPNGVFRDYSELGRVISEIP